MANPEHLEILKQQVELWNKWRGENPDIRPDLVDADLAGAILRGFDLSTANLHGALLTDASLAGATLTGAELVDSMLDRADLRRVNFGNANLSSANANGTNLRGATLSGANFAWASLIGADISNANLLGASLFGADLGSADLGASNLSDVNFQWANLKGTDFNGATMRGTNFGDVDLSVAKNLETVLHNGPSVTGIDTIYKSRGKIPEVFLRGCGVPDEFIAYIGSMVGRPIEYYSCFISYSTGDQEFADRLHADLQAKGVRCWFAPHDIQGGKKIHEQIDEAIRLHDRLLLILSEHSMSSEWVKTEIAKARKRETKDKRVLFPVRLVGFERLRDWECFDGDTGKDSAREIREYFIPDFSNWKEHDSYRAGLQRLVKDLKAVDSG